MKKLWIAVLALAVSLGAVSANAAMGKQSDKATVAAITQLENDQSKASNANDMSWVEKNYADDWTGGFSGGTWMTKASVLSDAKDSANNKMNHDEISDVKVRVYGNTAIATYTDSYDAMMHGDHRVKTVLTTDTWVRMNGMWKLVASHSSVKT